MNRRRPAGASVGLAETIAPATPAAVPLLRQGTIVSSTARADVARVQLIGGDEQDFPYAAGYVPIPGDVVNVLCIAAGATMQGLILGGAAGKSGNLVTNGDFRAHPQPDVSTSRLPHTWGEVPISGTPPVVGMYLHTTYQRPLMFFGHASSAASDHLVYSAAFPVIAGETLYLDACTDAFNVTASLTVTLRVAFYTEATDAWNTGSFNDTLIYTDNGAAPFTTWHTGSITVPEAAAYARVAVRAAYVGGAFGYTLLVGHVEAHR